MTRGAIPSGHRSAPPVLAGAREALETVWGYPDFRFHQRRMIVAALRGRDCLAVLPTGGGKSLGFQLPALLLPGLTLVISPLISLMQDQVAALRGRGVAAAYLSSTQRPAVQAAVWDALGAGRLRLLYAAPERLRSLVPRLRAVRVARLAIDEAHCISEWGHEFRPTFRALGRHRAALGRPPTLAVTATATPETRRDIIRVLRLVRPVTVVQSFDRPNLYLTARRCRGEHERLWRVRQRLRQLRGSAIVYTPTRERCDGVAAILRRWGIDAAPYHAGLPGAARRALLGRFLTGRLPIMVATSAFGMGIDKPDVRLVAHLGVPPRPESYFQEAGRAGRDGEPACCELLWLDGDLVLARRLAGLGPSGIALSPARRRAHQHALTTMHRYLTTRRCRRRILLAYLGERPQRCAGCDRCGAPRR